MKSGKYVMLSHSLITIAWMFCAWPFYWILGRDPTLWSIFVTGWTCLIIGTWYGREQYTEELRYREIGEGGPIEKLPSLVPFLWSKWNLDFIVPVAIAVILGVAFVAHVWKLYGWDGR